MTERKKKQYFAHSKQTKSNEMLNFMVMWREIKIHGAKIDYVFFVCTLNAIFFFVVVCVVFNVDWVK